ncbi:hypothetical protein [Hymenobacter psoromatis]|uniref:hypothetical protein n=1 Tax=Hymenobacter psoromatis TaxID=1484116 RepID=UPI001CBE8494|nr:hypothetical protein [Hymenobacter psoromatis]
MKKSLLTLAFAAGSLAALAQTTPAAAPASSTPAVAAAPTPAGYAEQLSTAITQVMSTNDAATLTSLCAKLERLAAAVPTDWLPRYYQAYALLMQARGGKDAQPDALLDRAEAALKQARQLNGDESELLALQASIYQGRLTIDPMQRAQEYSPLVMETTALAESLNPANPRPYLIEANQLYYTPEMYGGGTGKARPLYEAAKAKFAAFHPAGPLAPNWGESYLLTRLKSYGPATAAK